MTIDVRAKVLDRNRQWEDALAHLREAMDRPVYDRTATVAVAAGASELASLELQHQDAEWEATHRVAGMELCDAGVTPSQAHLDAAAQSAWDDLRFDSRLPGEQLPEWPAHTGRQAVLYHLPPQSLWAPDTLRLTAMRRRHTWKKLAMQELSTGFLVHKLIRLANLARFTKSASEPLKSLSPVIHAIASLTKEQSDHACNAVLATMETLRLTSVDISVDEVINLRRRLAQPGYPTYFQDADGDFYNICEQMNNGIKQLFDQCKQESDREKAITVAKICHNLLVSTASPDLHTFNLLISGFKLWRRAELVDYVIAAFASSKIRPNELACKQILSHYTAQSRPDDFTRFVAKMRGVGDALMLADPTVTINEASQERLARSEKNKVYQKIYPTPMVFAALISGVMKFAGFDRALDIYYDMKLDGWGLDVTELTKLLADCIRRSDWEGGTYIWEEMNSIISKSKPREMAKAYYHMLSLCSVTGNTTAFNQVLNEVVRRGLDRRSILNAAMKTTSWAQHKKHYLAPAWAADNLMIAVSGYVQDAKSTQRGSEMRPQEEDHEDTFLSHNTLEDSSCPEHLLTTTMTADKTKVVSSHDTVDSKKAWTSWIEHELGEIPKDTKS